MQIKNYILIFLVYLYSLILCKPRLTPNQSQLLGPSGRLVKTQEVAIDDPTERHICVTDTVY